MQIFECNHFGHPCIADLLRAEKIATNLNKFIIQYNVHFFLKYQYFSTIQIMNLMENDLIYIAKLFLYRKYESINWMIIWMLKIFNTCLELKIVVNLST